MAHALGQINVDVQTVGLVMTALYQYASKVVNTMVIVHYLIFAPVKKDGVEKIVQHQYVHKVVIMVENVLRQIHANASNGRIIGEMDDSMEEYRSSRPPMVILK